MRTSPPGCSSQGSTSTTCRGDQRLPTYNGTLQPAPANDAIVRKVRERCDGRIGTAVYLLPVAPAWFVISRASAQGWVPSAVGHGICHPPLLSEKPLVSRCMASTSCRNRPCKVSDAAPPTAGP